MNRVSTARCDWSLPFRRHCGRTHKGWIDMNLIKFHTGDCSPVQFIIECTMNFGHTVGIVCLEGFDKSTVSTVSTVKTNHVTFRILIVKVFVNNLFISWIVSMKSCFRALCKGPSAGCPRTSVSMYCKTAVEAALVIISAMCYISGGRKDHHFHLDLPNFRLRNGGFANCCHNLLLLLL